MTTPRISYAHLLAKPNPKHIDSLLRFFEEGRSKRGTGGFGVEIEHLPVHNGDDTAVSYYEENGVETLLKRIAPYYDKEKEYWENGHLVGLGREGIAVSLEPGGQVECSLGILKTPQELLTLYRSFRRDIDPVLDELGFRLVNYGYQPKSGFADVKVNPKDRYDAMTRYLGRVGQFGPCMMRCSASTQVSIDYVDEQDSIDKLRLGTIIGPILAWYFRNTPYFEGAPNPWPLLRQRMWDYLDPQRTNVIPGLFDKRFGWEEYAIDVLSTPLMFADLTHTPEARGLSGKELHHPAFYENAGEVYPDRELNPYEINHIISTHFNDVRMKNFIELRHWDSLPIERRAADGDHRVPVLRAGEQGAAGKLLRGYPRRGRVRGEGEPAGARRAIGAVWPAARILEGVPGIGGPVGRRARRSEASGRIPGITGIQGDDRRT